eukprot:1019465-Alexandrium_andersonii.AAC.1
MADGCEFFRSDNGVALSRGFAGCILRNNSRRRSSLSALMDAPPALSSWDMKVRARRARRLMSHGPPGP